MKFSSLIIALSSCFTLSAMAQEKSITVKMIPAKGTTGTGTITFLMTTKGDVEISGSLSGLKPGKHGLHIHTIGDCSDANNGFKNSKGHFNQGNTNHGSLIGGHNGDLGNILVNKDNTTSFKIVTQKFNLKSDDKLSILGRAVVLHEGEDDEKSNPAGNSGNRVLCGVIK